MRKRGGGMSSPSVELQTAVFDRLVADTGVHALCADRIYDNVPEARIFPYISFGMSDYYEDDSDCIPARVETLQIDCWAQENGKKRPARELVDAVKAALHLHAPELPTHGLVEMRVVAARVFGDPDGITAHGVVTLQAMIEEN